MCRDNLLTEVSNEELEAFLARLKPQVAENEYKIAESLVHTLQELGDAHQQSKTRVRALLKQIYGEFSSEKMEEKPETEAERPSGEPGNSVPPKKQKPREGGLRAADDFHGAKREQILFGPDQKPNLCPNCQGKIHTTDPRQLIRYYAAPPVNATIYSVERLRCRHCETIVEAEIPKEVGTEKYDSTVTPWLAYSRYRLGVPMYRLALSQELFGIPLPVQTQYMHLNNGAELLRGIFEQMELEAASSSVFISDDTPNKILKMLLREDEHGKTRTGVYTSAVHAILENSISIQLYFTGNRHQGENMGELLRQRKPHTKKPLHMTDGSSHGKPKLLNTAESLEKAEYLFVNAARCLVHARRRFFKIREDYKEACDYLLGLFGKIFGIEAELLRNRAGPEERVRRHGQDSGPLMEEILRYCQDNLAKKDVEPNSSLGKAMTYFIEDYDALSLFLHDSSSPLHTNSAERMIKDVARHRKNSLFFRTIQGAKVGDIWLSVIKTCEANGINPWEYLKDLFQKNTPETLMPEHWLPWVWAARQKNTPQAKS